MTTKDIGDIGERAAERFLKKNGYKIRGRNCHFSHNELDIIAENDSFILFVEVKTRTADPDKPSPYGVPSSAVTRAKQSRLIEAAFAYLAKKPTSKQPRMDVIEIWLDKKTLEVVKLNHIPNAYGVN